MIIGLILQMNHIDIMREVSTSKENGLLSIFTGAFTHFSYEHFIGNFVLLWIFTAVIIKMTTTRQYLQIMILGLIIPYLSFYFLIDSSVMGLSGMTYALTFYAIVRGSLTTKFFTRQIFPAIIVLSYFILPTMLTNMTPIANLNRHHMQPRISWQIHLFGAIIGVILAIYHILQSNLDMIRGLRTKYRNSRDINEKVIRKARKKAEEIRSTES